MPALNLVTGKALKKKLSESASSMDGPEVRALKKKIRRIQRKRRTFLAMQERAAKKSTDETAEKTEDKAEKKAEEKKEE